MACGESKLQRIGNSLQVTSTPRLKRTRACMCDNVYTPEAEAACVSPAFWSGDEWPFCVGCFQGGSGFLDADCCNVMIGVHWTVCMNYLIIPDEGADNNCRITVNESGDNRLFFVTAGGIYPSNMNGGTYFVDSETILPVYPLLTSATAAELNCEDPDEDPSTCCPNITGAYLDFGTFQPMQWEPDTDFAHGGRWHVQPQIRFPNYLGPGVGASFGAGTTYFPNRDPREAGVLTIGDCTPPTGISFELEFYRV